MSNYINLRDDNSGLSPEEIPSITPFIVGSAQKTSCVVVCPGGGYGALADHEGTAYAQWLNTIGISAFVLKYRIGDKSRHPNALNDARRAIQIVRKRADEFNIDVNRVGIIGSSAGGHLAASASNMFDYNSDQDGEFAGVSARPDLAILCYPVISSGEFGHQGSFDNLIGDDKELREFMSMENRVTENTPPTFIWHTVEDQTVPVENALLYSMALGKSNVPYELHVFPKGQHGIGLATSKADRELDVFKWTTLCQEWLYNQGF